MVATIQKWGNNNALRFPKVLLNALEMKENDKVDIDISDNAIIIKRIKQHKTLKERVKAFYGKNNAKIVPLHEEEEITGAVGEEE